MKKPTLEEKEFLTPTEAAVYFGLNRQKFHKLLSEGNHNFVAYYVTRKLIIKDEFRKYLEIPGVKEALKNGTAGTKKRI